MWLFHGLLMLTACFLLFVSFYEVHTAKQRLVCLLPVAMLAVALADLGVARVEIDHRSVRIRGILQNDSFTWSEIESPPEDYAVTPFSRPLLQQRLAGGRIVRFPFWVGAKERRLITHRIQAQLDRPVD